MWKRAVCAKDCPDTCGLLARVEDGRIVQVKGDPEHPYTNGFICAKAAFFPDHVHSPERITTPLRRTGPRGSGEFAPIPWDQALDEVAGRMRAVAERHGAQAILPYYYAGHMGLIQRHAGHAFFNRLGAGVMQPTICGPAATAGFQASLGSGPSTEIQQAAESDCILIWGSNTLSTNVHAWPHFAKARKNGALLAVIDPYRTRTAKAANGPSDMHVMLRPGTDAALALAMMQVIIAEGLADVEFIAAHTIGFDGLRARAAEYPPSRAATICGVPEEQIIALARAYGRAKGPYIRTGWGPARQLAGGMAMRTIALLPALVNAFAKPGGGITRSLGGAPSNLDCLKRPDLRPPGVRTVNMVELGNALTTLDNPSIHMLYVYLSNPAAVAPQSREVLRGLARDDLFTVVQEMYLTDTARFADIILPGAGFLEVADLYRAFGHNWLQAAEPVIPPVGQSRPTLAIFQDLAARMGFDDEVFSLTEADFMDRILADNRADDHSSFMDGVDLDNLKAGRPVRLNIPANPYAGGVFNTPSGKVEFYSKTLEEQGLPALPQGEPVRDPEGGERYPLEFLTPPHGLLLNSSFNEIKKIRDRIGPAEVMIHPSTAKARGIQDGARVRVFNNRGACVLRAKVTEDTREDVLVAEGLRRADSQDGGANQLTSQRLTDMGQTCAFHCSRVAIEAIN